jgi:hypothetical protein
VSAARLLLVVPFVLVRFDSVLVLAEVRAESPWWMSLLVAGIGAALLMRREALADLAGQVVLTFGLPSGVAHGVGVAFKFGLIAIAGLWVLAGLGAFVLALTGPVG